MSGPASDVPAVAPEADTPAALEAEGAGSRRQLLSFRLGEEHYAVDILRVLEIRVLATTSRLPRAPAYVRGVMNLRGTVVPIVDLRRRLGLEPVPPARHTVVMLLRVESGEHPRTLGMVVDAVSDVVEVTREQERPAGEGSGFTEGLAMLDHEVLILLDVDRLLDPERFEGVGPDGPATPTERTP